MGSCEVGGEESVVRVFWGRGGRMLYRVRKCINNESNT